VIDAVIRLKVDEATPSIALAVEVIKVFLVFLFRSSASTATTGLRY
jgi:hypothetical protein